MSMATQIVTAAPGSATPKPLLPKEPPPGFGIPEKRGSTPDDR
jgi:hypothetical protein